MMNEVKHFFRSVDEVCRDQTNPKKWVDQTNQDLAVMSIARRWIIPIGLLLSAIGFGVIRGGVPHANIARQLSIGSMIVFPTVGLTMVLVGGISAFPRSNYARFAKKRARFDSSTVTNAEVLKRHIRSLKDPIALHSFMYEADCRGKGLQHWVRQGWITLGEADQFIEFRNEMDVYWCAREADTSCVSYSYGPYNRVANTFKNIKRHLELPFREKPEL